MPWCSPTSYTVRVFEWLSAPAVRDSSANRRRRSPSRRKVREQDFDGYVTTEAFVSRSPYFARPTGANQLNDGVRPDQFARMQAPLFRRHRLRKPVERRFQQEFTQRRVGFQERQRLRPQRVIRSTRSSDQLDAVLGLKLPCRVEDPIQLFPAPLLHTALLSESSR